MEQRKTYLLKNFFIFCGILIFCKVEAEILEKEQNQEITLASVLQNKILPPKLGENANKRVVDASSLNSISQDIEVFKEIVGPQKEKQEEEGEPESETQPEAEGAADETVAEEVAESENEPAAEEETKVVADGPAEPEAAKESEPEVEPPSNKETDESEMTNDEPAKEEEIKRGKEDVIDKDININGTSCFDCTNSEDVKCSTKPTKQVTCKKVNEGDKGKHNGCYTLYQVDTNTTMRGCVDDLAEDGLKYCLTHAKFCNLCYSNDCNFKIAPSAANNLQFDIYSWLLFFATSCFVIIINKI